MTSFFRKLPLSTKLMLIGIIPVLFLIYLSGQLYKEKKQRVTLVTDYINKIDESGQIARLINELETERKYSYEYALKKDSYGKVVIQRPRTNAALEALMKSNDPALVHVEKYTFLDDLPSVRASLDSSYHYPADAIMQYFTNAIFRLNTLNTVSSASNIYLQPVNKDLVAQRLLFQMITYLGIIRTNIYNALYTRQYMTETLLGTVGVYKVFKTYEKEFILKAPPDAVKNYNQERTQTELSPTIAYIDKVFSTFKFDSTYNAAEWWDISSTGRDLLKEQQLNLWEKAEKGMKAIYEREVSSSKKTLFFLVTAIVLVITFIAYTIRVITQMLTELKVAAEKISLGGTGLQFHDIPGDVMGSLAQSILKIDRNNLALANAASAIGTGNFDVQVKPRSSQDVLGNSIEKMKEDLRQLTKEKDKVQQETIELMNRKDDFLSIASHELKTPVTSLKAYAQLLQMDSKENTPARKEMMLSKMDAQVDKLTALITDLLDTSKMQNGKLVYNKYFFRLDDLVQEIVSDMQTTITSHEIILAKNTPLKVFADRERIGQVLNNFLTNAIKYCPDCEKILVSVEEKEKMAICSVKDFGDGISEDQRARIFERFYRVTGKNLYTYPGLGLGLFIAKEIIERHHGSIWLESEPGKGSTFYFSLPFKESLPVKS